jgi:hypothetical protein
MDCIILDRMNQPPKGGGEPAIIGIGAIVANAVYDATGARCMIYHLIGKSAGSTEKGMTARQQR